MNILGVGGLLHDPSAAILRDGVLTAAVESEKVTRHHREQSIMPIEAMDAVIADSGLVWDDIDLICTNWDARPLTHKGYLPFIGNCLIHGIDPLPHLTVAAAIAAGCSPTTFRLQLRQSRIPPIHAVRHHLAHVGISYTLSPYNEAAVAIIDGAAETDATSLFHGQGRNLRQVSKWTLVDGSLGNVFAMATQHIGFRMLGDEYKVMALAAMGRRNERFERFFRAMIPDDGGRYRIDRRYTGAYLKSGYNFPRWVCDEVMSRREPSEELEQKHLDFAKAMQDRICEVLIKMLIGLRHETRSTNLCLGGGVAMNSVINGRIAEETGFDKVYVPPVAHDGGTAAGAAAWYAYHKLGQARPRPLTSPHIASAQSSEQIDAEVRRSGLPMRHVENAPALAAKLIAQGHIIAWVQGRAEFGPRALGNRSLLADPRNPETRGRLSHAIKGRESFRPLAVSVLSEHFTDYFSEPQRNAFMTMVAPATDRACAEIPSGVHIDGTSRPQSVDANVFPRFHRLLIEFHQLTGVAAVLNTSFNISGEPMVRTARDALRTFSSLAIDHMFIDNWLVGKSQGAINNDALE